MKQILVLLLLGYTLAFSQETVTIPKSRLEELERKEAELEKLKSSAAISQATVQNPTSKGPEKAIHDRIPSQITAPVRTPPVRVTPSLASLPALENGTLVLATDLAAHYGTDAAAADERYRKHTFKVQGEIAGFEKPPLVRNYLILLKTAEPQTRVICDFYPPDKFKAVFTVNSGTALVGLLPGESRVPLAKAGDTVVIEGRCKGLTGGGVKLTDCELKSN